MGHPASFSQLAQRESTARISNLNFSQTRLPRLAVGPKRSAVEGPAVSFCPSDLTAPNKSHRPPLCHPERTRISYLTALPAATYAALRKESRMTSTEATAFDRKSGGAEGSAVRPGSRTKVSVPLVPPQTRKRNRGRERQVCENSRLPLRSFSVCGGWASCRLCAVALAGRCRCPAARGRAAHWDRCSRNWHGAK
jgi:hypothetical protein